MSQYKVGNIIKCRITGIEKYGIFVNVDPWYNGLIHISEVSDGFVRDINDYVKVDEYIYSQIIGIDEEKKHLKLSIKNINYKMAIKNNGIKESPRGFGPLRDNLDSWINEKIEEYK